MNETPSNDFTPEERWAYFTQRSAGVPHNAALSNCYEQRWTAIRSDVYRFLATLWPGAINDGPNL